MAKLSLSKIELLYLAHPLNIRHEAREWELGFEQRTGINLLNPFYDVPTRQDIYRLDAGENGPAIRRSKAQCVKVVNADLNLIHRSDGIVAIVEKGQESFGTPMEIFYNSVVLKRPTYIITDTLRGHPWIKGLSTQTFRTYQDFEQYVNLHVIPKRRYN